MLIPIIILSLVQGITEFLPISSSAHLILTHELLSENQSQIAQKTIDIAVHIGTLFAVILYFKKDFMDLIIGGIDIIRFKTKTKNAHKSLLILISSIPVIICGLILFNIDMTLFDSLYILAWMSIIFGIALYFADKKPQDTKQIDEYTFKQALFYGLAQCIALIPGVSRSGITMTAGRFLGHSRTEAAKYSLLMGMVTITAAGTLTGLSVFQDQSITSEFLTIIIIGIIISFIAAYITIFFMMKWISSSSFTPFVIYRIALGIALLTLLYSGII